MQAFRHDWRLYPVTTAAFKFVWYNFYSLDFCFDWQDFYYVLVSFKNILVSEVNKFKVIIWILSN